MSHADYFAARMGYAEKRAEINQDAYTELIELVVKHGNRRLKDQMWALADRTREKTTAALTEFKAASKSSLSPQGVKQ